MTKKTVYISVPMAGRSKEDIIADIAFAKEALKDRQYPMEIITPFDVGTEIECRLEQSMGISPNYFDYLISDIDCLLQHCDAVYFCDGWRESKGCRLEMAAAQIFEKTIMFNVKK